MAEQAEMLDKEETKFRILEAKFEALNINETGIEEPTLLEELQPMPQRAGHMVKMLSLDSSMEIAISQTSIDDIDIHIGRDSTVKKTRSKKIRKNRLAKRTRKQNPPGQCGLPQQSVRLLRRSYSVSEDMRKRIYVDTDDDDGDPIIPCSKICRKH